MSSQLSASRFVKLTHTGAVRHTQTWRKFIKCRVSQHARALSVFSRVVVFQNLRREETYLQLFDSLEKLNKIVDETFGNITRRVRPRFALSR